MPFDYSNPNAIKTLMGWNQSIEVLNVSSPVAGGITTGILRVSDYEIGSKQTGDAPDYVTGATDRNAYSKGPVEIEGSMTFPLTNETNTGGIISGLSFFIQGAELCKSPQSSFSIAWATQENDGEVVNGCKIATAKISCNAREAIQCSATIWGVSNDRSNTSNNSGEPIYRMYGTPNGVNVKNKFKLVQIPMWDACKITGAPPGMLVTGFSIEIDNKLQRNYTMGSDETDGSPWGLNATSISTGQRFIKGSLTWQSNPDGKIAAILGSGIKALTIRIGGGINTTIYLKNVLWNAQPPRLAPGDRVTCESSFTALGDTGDFDAMTITKS
jgi:hypothetical protein